MTGRAQLMTLHDAVAELIHDGDTVAIRGLHPPDPRTPPGTRSSARAGATCTLVRMTPDMVYDQLIGPGASTG